MTRINLLPWRDQLREQRKKFFITLLLISVLASIFIVFLVNCYALTLVNKQISRNEQLQKEINGLDRDLKEIKALKQARQVLLSRMSIIRDLQSARTLVVHLFDELSRILPSGVYITQLKRNKEVVSLWGYAESNTAISLLMKNIESNFWLKKPILTEIKTMKDEKLPANNEFKLNLNIRLSKL